MRAFLLLALVLPIEASPAGSASGQGAHKILASMIKQEVEAEAKASNQLAETTAINKRKVAGLDDAIAAFSQRLEEAEGEESGADARAKEASKKIAQLKIEVQTRANDVTALTRVLKVTEAQTLEQVQEIDNGLAAVALAKQKVKEMGGNTSPASLLQTLMPKIDLDDYESLYNAKKGKKLGLLAKGGNAFTSSSDAIMKELDQLEAEMIQNKKAVQKDLTSYKNKRNQMKATKTAEIQQLNGRIETRESDKAFALGEKNEAETDIQSLTQSKNEASDDKAATEESQAEDAKHWNAVIKAKEETIKFLSTQKDSLDA